VHLERSIIDSFLSMQQELLKELTTLQQQVQQLMPVLGLEAKKQQVLEMEDAMQQPGFWDNPQGAQGVSQRYNALKSFVDFWTAFPGELAELHTLIEQNTDESKETIQYLTAQVVEKQRAFASQRVTALLNRPYDDHNAIMAVHAGAGGTDAQDFAEMLFRMYSRYCERKGLRMDVIELSRGGEAGIKSVLFEVQGPFAYGYLKAEAGVHRLVRLSPFNPAHTRETSFALVEVLPQLTDTEVPALDPKDLKIEANTSSGHGGQSVNTTYSAIRITHIPTGIRVNIQNERSQHQNKELALKIIAARVKALEEEKLEAEKKQLRGEFKSAEWGNQIRSYVLHPYKLVKDHRTGFETSDPESVLDGEIDEFIERYLEWLSRGDSNDKNEQK
jgi:peptide chain release factor 2